MADTAGRCEVAACGIELIGESVFDRYFNIRVCKSCFDNHFREAEEHGFGEWFDGGGNKKKANYEFSDYPPEFWRKVGAFVDVSSCEPPRL